MPNQQLKDYINQQLSKGASREQISAFLIQSGWKQIDIDSALENDASGPTLPPPPPPPPPPSNSNNKNDIDIKSNPNMWDTFAHVILFISLYVMATAAGIILHYLIDQLFPTETIKSLSNLRSTTINWYLASLIVATPIFSITFIDVQKRSSKNPYIRNIKVRKVFIYITLIVTFLIMLTSVTSSVYNLLNGNISLNSFLHLVVNFSIPALIFGYFAFQVRGDREVND